MTALSWSVLVIGAALTLLLFAFVVRRLIGVRVPVPRTLAAGIVAVLVFSPARLWRISLDLVASTA